MSTYSDYDRSLFREVWNENKKCLRGLGLKKMRDLSALRSGLFKDQWVVEYILDGKRKVIDVTASSSSDAKAQAVMSLCESEE
jgi:hypothetical protein